MRLECKSKDKSKSPNNRRSFDSPFTLFRVAQDDESYC